MSLIKLLLKRIPRPWLIRLSFILRPLLKLWYKGKGVVDPIDCSSFRSFMPYGYEHVRKGVLSPSTLSLERHRSLWLYVNRETSLFTSDKPIDLLHIAPEQCFYSILKNQSHINYTTFDLNSPLASVHGDIIKMPFADCTFDCVFCNHVLEHITDDQLAMSELFRILRPGGWGIVQVPMQANRDITYENWDITDPAARTMHFGQYDHVRWYGRVDFFERLTTVGFQIEAINVGTYFSEEEIQTYVLDKNEILPIIRRPL